MTELTRILSSFSENEMKRFDDFVHSPYFNKSEKLITFFDELKMSYPFQEVPPEEIENVYTKVLDEDYNPSTARDLPSALLRLVENFLAAENIFSKLAGVSNHLLEELIKKGFDTLLEKNLSRIGEEIENETQLSSSYLLERFRYEINKANALYLRDGFSKKETIDKGLVMMENSISHLSSYFLAELISIYVNLVIYFRSYAGAQEANLAMKVIETIDLKSLKEILMQSDNAYKITEIYYLLMEMFRDTENNDNYTNYKNMLTENISHLSTEEAHAQFINLIRYCILKLSEDKDNKAYREELFNVYEIILDEGLYKNANSNFISVDLFRDMLLNGLRLKNYEWTSAFIEKYIIKLKPAFRKQMKNFCYMYLYYESGQYSKALEFSSSLIFDHFIYKFDARNVLVRIYYELGYNEEALCQIKSYNEFLDRDHHVSKVRKARYMNFIKFVRWIILNKEGRSRLDLGYVRKKINDEQNIAFKEYLNEKIDEIEQGRRMTG